jgi:hypothetical protein
VALRVVDSTPQGLPVVDDGTKPRPRRWGLILGAAAAIGVAAVGGVAAAVAVGGSASDTATTNTAAVPPVAPEAPAPITTEPGQVPANSLPGGERPPPVPVAPPVSTEQDPGTVSSESSSEARVVEIIDEYFNAVNAGDYSAAYDFTSQSRQAKFPYSDFVRGYDTTNVYDVTVMNTSETADGPTVDIQYRSTQAPSNSPNGSTCLIWTQTFEFVYEDGDYRVQKFKNLGDPAYRNC